MSLILAWLFFPLVLAAIGLGWGATVQWIGGRQELGPLTIPIGLATVICLAGILTSFNGTAPIAAPIAAIGALLGVGFVWGRARLGTAPALAALGVLFVYGAPVIMSGEATFLGYVRLDDTATWFNLVDWLFTHGRAFGVPIGSTYELNALTNLATSTIGGIQGASYPSGAFMLLGVGHWVTRIDIAWLFQPYMACCAAAVALCLYALLAPLVEWRWLRAFVAFVAAQSALLFGYATWGGIKELTGAFLLALGAALSAQLVANPRSGWRDTLPLGIVGGALMLTLGPSGALAYGLPIAALVGIGLLWHALEPRRRPPVLGAVLAIIGLAALAVAIFGLHAALFDAPIAFVAVVALALVSLPLRRFFWLAGTFLALLAFAAAAGFPLWLVLAHYLSVDGGSYTSVANAHTELGNLVAPLRAIQIAGIWPAGDFRDVSAGAGAFQAPGWFPRYPLIWLVFVSGAGAVAWSLYKRRVAIAVYLLLAVGAAALGWVDHTTPWLLGKALAISSPAVLLAGLLGGAFLFRDERTLPLIAGVVVLAAIAGGVIWSNWLQYRDVTLAPRDQLAELETIGSKVAGHAPTFINEYEIYADRHFLRAGAPIEPAEYRTPYLGTLNGAVLTNPAWADIDAFPLATLAPYKSLVIRISPVESRPPSSFNLVWQGRYYALYQQPAHPTHRVLLHVPLGDTQLEYCGNAEFGRPFEPLCAIQPAAVPRCSRVLALGRQAAAEGGELLAYERANPIVLRATQTSWPLAWTANSSAGSLVPTTPGTAFAHISIPTGPHRYQLWLGGSFARGFQVSIDGHQLGGVANELNNIGDYNEVGPAMTLARGVHTIAITYPPASSLAPGNADSEQYTGLDEIALQPLDSPSRMIELQPPQASELCGRSLDWIEIVR